jgi:hypothetical protein
VNDAVGFELSELLDQHLLTDAVHPATQLTEAAWAGLQLPQQQRLPLSSHHFQHNIQPAQALESTHDTILT